MSKKAMQKFKVTYISLTLRLIRFFLAAHLGSRAEIDEVEKRVGEIKRNMMAHVAKPIFLSPEHNIIITCNNHPVLDFFITVGETSSWSSDSDTQGIGYRSSIILVLSSCVVSCVYLGLQLNSGELVGYRIAWSNGCLTSQQRGPIINSWSF